MIKVKSLFLAANPIETERLSLDREIREITSKIRASEYRNSIELVSVWAVRPDDLLQSLNEQKPQIVHFSGHGSSIGEIVLVDELGNVKPIAPNALRILFATFKDNIRIAILNACYSKIQAEAITEIIDCAIGMSTAITDEAAITFIASFYRALGFGRSVEEAFNQGKTAVLLAGLSEENIPELLVKSGVDANQIILIDEKGIIDNTGNPIINSPLSRPLGLTTITDSNHPLHNLPQPDYQNFVGRDKEIAEIVKTLQPYPYSQHPVISIDGIGGIGKSALALEIALRYLYRYKQLNDDEQFSAIIWATAKHTILTADGVKRRNQTIDSLDGIYTTIAVTLNREDITRAQISQQDMLVRQALTAQRTLLVIDNLETIDDERVLSFIREVPAPTKVIVTTRHRIDVARTVRLIGMPEIDALKLITETANAKNIILGVQASKRLYARTGGVPLAIVWSLARISFGYTIESVLTELSYPHNDIAKFCFDSIVKAIWDQPSYTLLLALSLFETDASREALGVVANLPLLDRDEGLVGLERLSLVNKNGSRFSMLPLTKNYVVEEARKNLNFVTSATKRWAEHLINLVGQSPEKYWIQDQATILQEGENFYSLLEWSTKQQDFNVFLQIVRFAVLYMQYTGRRVEAQKLALDGQKTARQYNAPSLQAWLCADVGWMLSQQGAHTEAILQIEESIRIYQLLADMKGICFAKCLWAQALRHTGTINDAESLLLEVNEEATRIDYKEGIALAQFELGKLARESKEWDRAFLHFKEAYVAINALIEDSFADIFSLAILGNFGSAALNLGMFDEAKTATLRVLEVLETWREKSFASNYAARMCLQAARIEKKLNNYAAAKKHAELASLIYESTKNQTGYNDTKAFLGLLR